MTGSILVLSAPIRRRGLRLGAALAPLTILAAWLLAAPSGGVAVVQTLVAGTFAAGVLSTYAPIDGRPALGCTRCAVMAGLSVPVAGAFLLAARTDPSMATLAVLLVTFGLAQRLRDPATCDRTGQQGR